MKLFFNDGDHTLTATEIQPNADTILPPVVMVGQYCFLFHELGWNSESGEWGALYQTTQPLVLPASQGVNSHFMLRQTIGGQKQ